MQKIIKQNQKKNKEEEENISLEKKNQANPANLLNLI